MEYKKSITFSRNAYLYSILFHAAVVLLLLYRQVAIEVEPPKFYELSLGAVSHERIEQIIDEARRSQTMREQAITPKERVVVPDRKMIEIEEPTISVPSEQRMDSRDIVTDAHKQSIEVASPDIRTPSLSDDIITMDRKESFQGSKIMVGEQPGAGIETAVIGEEEAINFTLEGEITGRKTISTPLPAYPEGLNKNAVIKIAFSVLPDGAVSSTGMVPVRKENAVLEELAMTSLKLWRFEPLADNSDKVQAGVVTFVFKVK